MDEQTAAAIERLRKNKDLANQLMRSDDGQALLSLLSRGDGGASLERAAQDAAKGDTAALAQMLRSLMANKEAAAIMSRLNDSAKH